MVAKSMKNLRNTKNQQLLNNFLKSCFHWFKYLWIITLRTRGIWSRALFCWLVGMLILSNDEINSYDWRFQMRGIQPTDPGIILLTVHPQNLSNFKHNSDQGYLNSKEFAEYTDNFFYDPKILKNILTEVLKQNPKKIAVLLSFNENTHLLDNNPLNDSVFFNSKVIWSYDSFQVDGTHRPVYSNDVASNVGHYLLSKDSDGLIRRLPSGGSGLSHIIEKLTSNFFEYKDDPFINFRGSVQYRSPLYLNYSYQDILNHRISPMAFNNKWVLISGMTQNSFLTPLGPMTRAEIIAQALDTHIHNRWIKRSSYWLYAGLLVIIMFISIVIITQYPQRLAFFLLVWLTGLTTSLSLWVFDSFNYWTPIFSPLVQIITTWIIFMGYISNRLEKQHFELQQEKEYLKELEQLKNNFVSLISHDLKTPIAKIQSSLGRLKTKSLPEDIQLDIQNMQLYSEELNKYIRSIIQLLQVESREFQLNKEIIDINELIKEVIKNLTPLANEKNIHISDDLEPIFSMEADQTLIREVLLNLIENAIKYSGQNTTITVTSKEVENKVWIEIQDQGEGISETELKTIFGKFVRGKSQDLKTKGTGLGLYLVKYFIELHGGNVYLESQIGIGTKVYFSLPIDMEV